MEMLKGDDNDLRRFGDERSFHARRSGSKEAVPTLIELLKDKDSTISKGAIRCLTNLGPRAEAAVPELEKMLEGADTQTRLLLEAALKSIKGRR